MKDEHALFQQILAQPDDDSLRLDFAAAVRTADPDHAELIRIQVELAARPPNRPRDLALRDRERLLLRRVAPRLLGSVGHIFKVADVRRGFVSGGVITARRLLEFGEEALALAPVTHLVVQDLRELDTLVFECPVLRRIQSLDLRFNGLDDTDAGRLAACTHLSQLRYLDVSNNAIDTAGLAALLTSSALAEVLWVGFAANRTGLPTEPERIQVGPRWLRHPAPRPRWF